MLLNLEQFNQRLRQKGSYLLVRKDDIIVYMGEDPQKTEVVIPDLPAYEEYNADSENGVYIGGEAQVLVKQVDFAVMTRTSAVHLCNRCDEHAAGSITILKRHS